MSDKRASPRRRVFKAGQIQLNGSAIDCIVRSLSSDGAAVEIESIVGVPDVFMLVVPSESLKRICSRVWQTQRRIGVKFI